MSNFLTSWKEIGQYLGKGVRTVQRWEREAGLPVRRNDHSSRRVVLAIPEELDEWARTRTRGPAGPAAEALRREMSALRDEHSDLRKRVDAIEALMTETLLQPPKAAGRNRRRLFGAPGPSEAES